MYRKYTIARITAASITSSRQSFGGLSIGALLFEPQGVRPALIHESSPAGGR